MKRLMIVLVVLYGLLTQSCRGGADIDPAVTAAIEAREGEVVAGRLAPDFTLPTPDGVGFTLSGYRGGPVVLDFWGWDPSADVKFASCFEKYGQRITFVSVACAIKENKWERMINSYGSGGWVNLYDIELTAEQAFGVSAPTRFIIGPGGIILGRFAATDDAFYTLMDSLYGRI